MGTIVLGVETAEILRDAIKAYRERTEVIKNSQPTIYNFNITVKDENEAELAAKVITKHFQERIK